MVRAIRSAAEAITVAIGDQIDGGRTDYGAELDFTGFLLRGEAAVDQNVLSVDHVRRG
jgi:hypothetical protein